MDEDVEEGVAASPFDEVKFDVLNRRPEVTTTAPLVADEEAAVDLEYPLTVVDPATPTPDLRGGRWSPEDEPLIEGRPPRELTAE